jgi:putative NADPH-quinone reductase
MYINHMFNLFSRKNPKKIFLLLGQEDYRGSFCCSLADAYVAGAEKAGHTVRRHNLGDVAFDPILHKGYKEIQPLEPGLKKIQEDIVWADHVVIIYPTWWSSMPAILKGMFDRMWLPGFAFHFQLNGMSWNKLLKGKTGHVFTTMDSWPFVERVLFGDSTNEIGRAILGFSGIAPIKITKIGPYKNSSDAQKNAWRTMLANYGKNAR